MRVLVCGGRDFTNRAYVLLTLDKLHAQRPISDLIHGGASGADALAGEWAAHKRGIRRYISKPDWDRHGKAAGPIRNAHMLTWKPDLVVAFPGGKGTAHMVKIAREAGIEVIEYA